MPLKKLSGKILEEYELRSFFYILEGEFQA